MEVMLPSGLAADPVLAVTEPKGALNHFCQRYCQRSVTKEDVVYTSAKYDKVFQATVTLSCIEGQQFVGEVAPNLKDAEKNAARQALLYFEPMVDQLPPPTGKSNNNKKRKTPEGSPGQVFEEPAAKRAVLGDGEASENPAMTPKVHLNNVCMKLLKRPLTKGEILYETNNTAQGFQSTVRLPCLPGEMGELAWAGEVAPQTKQAEQNAAAQALEAINDSLDDPQEQVPLTPRRDNGTTKGNSTPKGNNTTKGNSTTKGSWGKGKNSWSGKGGWDSWGGYGPGSGGCHGGYRPSYGAKKGGYEGYEGYEGDGMGCMGGKYGSGGKGPKGGRAGREEESSFSPERRPQSGRSRVTKVAITGEIVEWRGRYGWLKSHATIQHAASKKHGGKIFVSKSEFADPNLHLEEGTVLQFHVYEYQNGLGAEEVQAF